MNKKIRSLVTGGAGFIGSHVVDRLLGLGQEVIVIDNLSSGKEDNLQQHKNNPSFHIYVKDICGKDIEKLFAGVSTVFHIAAIPRVQFSIRFPEETNRVNIAGTLNVLQLAKKAGVRRFIYSGSSSAYGNQTTLPLTESMTPNPMSPYALQKLVGEYYCQLYNLLFSMETISLRYFNVYGPRQDPSGGYACLIPKTIHLVQQGNSPEIYGDGEQTRDFTYVKDVVEANILAAFSLNKKSFGEVLNVGGGNNISVNRVVNYVINGKNIKPKYNPPVIEPKNTLAGIQKIKDILCWESKFSFEEGLKETMDWYLQNNFNQ
jgi:nucleoside-diphosphate-sugar epimerase